MMEDRKKALFICYDGAILHENRFVPYLFNGLYQISKRSDYELVLLTGDNEVRNDVFSSLENEGIVFDQILSSIAVGSDYDLTRSFVVCDGMYDIYSAIELGLRVFVVSVSRRDEKSCHDSVIVCDDWLSICSYLTDDGFLIDRKCSERRKTNETDIALGLNIDGVGNADIKTGIGFFDHMLEQVARHAKFDIFLDATGDLNVDEHHTIEDCALVLGSAVKKALADKRGIERYGFEIVAMDEVASTVALDFSGRPELVWKVQFSREYIGDFPTELFKHFFRSFSVSSGSSLYVSIDSEGDNHHMAEAIFKAFGRALRHGVKRIYGDVSLPSTKGVL